MIPSEMEELFGKEIAKVYEFNGSVPESDIPQVFITVKFAEAIGNNLLESTVTNANSRWFIYTKTPHVISSDMFVLVAELPLLTETVVEETL